MSVNPASVTNPPAQFPEDFVFGGATAAYQVEGETRTHGKGKVAWDDFLESQGRFSPDPASDFYNQYPVDLELCEEFGINGIRLSIAWSRIFPNGTGKVNPEGVQFYHDLFAECHKHHVEPFVTLHHFDTPLPLFEKGDFLNRETIDTFVDFATFCFKEYADQVTYWFTFNEIWADASNTYIEGTFPGGVKAHLAEAFQCEHNMMLAHAKAVLAFHNGGFKGKIGVIQSLEFKYPLNENDPADIKAANNEHVLQNQFLLDATFCGDYAPDTLECANRLAAISGGTIEILDEDLEIMREAALYNDYLGVNNYQCRFLKAYDGENDLHHNGTGEKGTGRWRVKGIGEHVNKPGIPTTDWDWIIYPEGLFDLLVYIKQRYPNYKHFILIFLNLIISKQIPKLYLKSFPHKHFPLFFPQNQLNIFNQRQKLPSLLTHRLLEHCMEQLIAIIEKASPFSTRSPATSTSRRSATALSPSSPSSSSRPSSAW